ncbi:DUF1304 domain-containing protein [Zhihengliuella salsuginis]|uniref:Membrane protein n=1 Tax=Zhihengliuella salsuginis TaxID=578222 RepID=A0ABQ3GJ96_9MICC|nr:DUF1304 domain-containing protein [Zhihengliuella salsuginis]GHD05921.1 membrane protein [Zhihengliuella salsuginis]
MIIAGLVLAALAAAVHVFIFYLESIAWTSPRARAAFGTTGDEALATRELAFNHGFYNLFLAILAAAGIASVAAGATTAGLTLTFAGLGSMAAAAAVLAISSPNKRAAAAKQGLLPAAGVVVLLLSLI